MVEPSPSRTWGSGFIEGAKGQVVAWKKPLKGRSQEPCSDSRGVGGVDFTGRGIASAMSWALNESSSSGAERHPGDVNGFAFAATPFAISYI